jgi:hypothetical protein
MPDVLNGTPFPQRSPPRLLTGAARGGLKPPPAGRPRRTYLHLWHSTTTDHTDPLHRHLPCARGTHHPCIRRSVRPERRPNRSDHHSLRHLQGTTPWSPCAAFRSAGSKVCRASRCHRTEASAASRRDRRPAGEAADHKRRPGCDRRAGGTAVGQVGQQVEMSALI